MSFVRIFPTDVRGLETKAEWPVGRLATADRRYEHHLIPGLDYGLVVGIRLIYGDHERGQFPEGRIGLQEGIPYVAHGSTCNLDCGNPPSHFAGNSVGCNSDLHGFGVPSYAFSSDDAYLTVSSMLFDNHHRPISYLRLAVTDRCNLRCFYCMPEEGIRYVPKKELLTFEEIERLVRLLADMGISKVRITGGEPFVRNDLMKLLKTIVEIPGIEQVHLTTNGVLTTPHVPELKALGIASVNLSLDTLDRQRFRDIARRDEFDRVWETFQVLLKNDLPVKINAVVMDGKNTEDILPLAALTKEYPVSVRFIEEMPFNGEGQHYPVLHWTHSRILSELMRAYPTLERRPDPPHATAMHYQVPGHPGDIGIIAAFSRTFCGTCNRIRVTAQGDLKTCLYDNGVLNLRDLLRSGQTNDAVKDILMNAFSNRPKDGFEAESRRTNPDIVESMSTIGG